MARVMGGGPISMQDMLEFVMLFVGQVPALMRVECGVRHCEQCLGVIGESFGGYCVQVRWDGGHNFNV